ncbi:Suppressor of Profilin deletion [Sporothrix epigloea]|uniref:Suppressor of Profilin deletion n=1 Tax=Sporothrix epigloea TaxID=1892477 RepID=A0ABP0D7W3_9PEZI
MDALTRSEYPSMLDHLPPNQAVQVLQDRFRRMGKVNSDIADFLAERRKIEEQYAMSLKKLVTFRVPATSAELGVFQPSWDSLLRSIDAIANSHFKFSASVEKDVETPLRKFQSKDEMASMNIISANLQSMAKELDEAQAQAGKLSKKSGKSNAQKIDTASHRLEGATQQWETQAPFIFETLQALDEKRVNHLRDIMTQLQTHECEQVARSASVADAMLNLVLEIRTEDEIQNFAQQTIQGRPRIHRRGTSTRHSSIAGSVSGNLPQPSPSLQVPQSQLQNSQQPHQSQDPPSTAASAASQSTSFQHPPRTPTAETAPPLSKGPSTTPRGSISQTAQPRRSETGFDTPPPPPPPPTEKKSEKKLRSRFGTLLKGRRQSVQPGFGQLNNTKNSTGPFNRLSVSSHGPAISPRTSYNNLNDQANDGYRLGSLAERPDVPPKQDSGATNGSNDVSKRTRRASSSGVGTGSISASGGGVSVVDSNTLNSMSVDDIFGVAAPPGPPPSQQKTVKSTEPKRDDEGFSIPAAANDPISQAQRDAAAFSGGEHLDEGDQAFKLSIQKEPVQEEDPQAKIAALSTVSNALQLGMPTRKTGTVRGRRDVRNTIYVPAQPTVPEQTTASPDSTAATPSTAASSMLPPNLPLSASRSSTFGSAFGSASTPTRSSALMALAQSESSGGAGTSDTQSVRSATSLSTPLAHLKHLDSSNAGLNTSIIESVSAEFTGGQIASVKVAGEIAFSYMPPTGSGKQVYETETIRINNSFALEAIGPNRIFVANTDQPGQYTIQTEHLQQKASVGFTFRAHAETGTALAEHCPITLSTTWKPTGDKLGLVLQYRLNTASRLASALNGQPLVLRNVVFIAAYEGARASGVQTKPTGTHLKEKHLVYWRMAEISLTEAWSKIVCRIVGEQGAEPQPGHVEMRWEYQAPAGSLNGNSSLVSVSRLQAASATIDEEELDPFADETAPSATAEGSAGAPVWVDVPGALQMISGKYESK